jgi:hypothetical protein
LYQNPHFIIASEAIHKSVLINWIASVFDLAMTMKRAFDTASIAWIASPQAARNDV